MRNFASMIASIALLSACEKDSDNTPSNIDLLTTRNWRITAITAGSPSTTATVDLYATMPLCEKDNFYKFGANKMLIVDEGDIRCSTADPQTTKSGWDFNSDQTKLTFIGSAISDDIVELSTTTLRLRATSSFTSNGYTVTKIINTTYTAF